MLGLNIDPSAGQLELALELASLADQNGLDLVAVQDHPYHRGHLDCWTLLSTLAAVTAQVHVMPNVANLPLRTPQIVAKSAASLAIISDGRVELGVGAGAMWDAIHAYGGPQREPGEAVDAFEEALAVIRALWSEDSARLDGEHYRLNGARPGPLPEDDIRLWVGSYGPRMLAITGRLGDGWTPTNRFAPPERVPGMQRRIDQAAEEAGRDPSEVRRNYNVMGVLHADAQPEDGERVVGSAGHWLDTLTRYAEDLGFDTFVFWPVEGDVLEQARVFCHEVVPRLRGRLGEQQDPSIGYL